MARKFYVIGNWKMYKTAQDAVDYIDALLPLTSETETTVHLAVPYTSISPASIRSKGTNIVIGAQNMNDVREGAFTGEIASCMLKEAGAQFVLIGHSERRQIFGETDSLIHRKLLRALQDSLQPVLCLGETLEDRESERTGEVLEAQISSALHGIPKEEISSIVFAYEPVWAIGTGKAATSEIAEEAHSLCRGFIANLFGKKRANEVSILYGGSVKPENVSDLLAQKNVDGVLVGGASLDPKTFAKIAITSVE